MLVKICGLSNSVDALKAIAGGADALGFVMGGKVLPIEVEPHAQHVQQIIKQVPKYVDSFVVTHLFEVDDILVLANYVQSTGIQVSEDIGVEKVKQLRAQTSKKIIKTIVISNEKNTVKSLHSYEPYCDFILLDTRFGGYTGGTGVTNDWKICQKIVKLAKKPVFIAGGLNPENVAEAIRISGPAGVDVSTGVSTYSDTYLRKDRKDEQKINHFIQTAKRQA